MATMYIETPIITRKVRICAGSAILHGDLAIPPGACGVVLFAHGSGSSRHSPRNPFVAEKLQHASLATLLMDLLTDDEDGMDVMTGHLRFDIGLLARRLGEALSWLTSNASTRSLPIGCFGASTGAAAALMAAAKAPNKVQAVVSRGGRPDLAEDFLGRVQAPVLLIVGENDHGVLDLNRTALRELNCEKRLDVVHGATHLFEEPGALDEVADLAADWFAHYLCDRDPAGEP